MAIPNQFPQVALNVRQAALQALVLRAGQLLEAKVLGTSANGITQVQIGKQTINLTLPVLMAAGSTLNLQAQGSGAQQKLVLLPQAPTSALTPAPTPTSQAPVPASVVTVSQQTQSTPQQTNASASQPNVSATLAPASPMPAPLPVVTRPGALQPLALQSGQQVEARVLGTATNGTTQLQIARQIIQVSLPTPMPAGATLRLRVEGNGAQQTLVTVPQPAPASAQTTHTTPQVPVNSGPALQPAPLSGPAAAQATTTTPAPATPLPGSPPTPISPPGPPPPSTPQAALTQMLQTAVQRQDSVGNLTTLLAAVLDKVQLPPPVVRAAQQVLAASLPLGPALNGMAVQRAIASSGIFQEAILAQAAPELAKGDLKTTLLVLRNTLVNWLGQTATTAVPPGPLPPPVRGALPRARSGNIQPIDIPEEPIEVGKVMLSRAEGSLARLRLHQHASLPETSMPGAPADWSTDIPVLIGNYQTVLQLRIHREGSNPDQPVSERGWQIHFAMDLPQLGEVGAQVGLRGGATSVRLWAGNALTATRMEEALPELSLSLAAAGLRAGSIIVRADEPAPASTSTGHFVDTLR